MAMKSETVPSRWCNAVPGMALLFGDPMEEGWVEVLNPSYEDSGYDPGWQFLSTASLMAAGRRLSAGGLFYTFEVSGQPAPPFSG